MAATTSTYVVRLIDCAKARGGIGSHGLSVCQQLKGWYSSVCQKASTSTNVWTADVQWLAKPPTPRPVQDAGAPFTVNMILFFIPIPRDSVILLHPTYSSGFVLDAVTNHSRSGETVNDGTTRGSRRTPVLGISEIYIDRLKARSDDDTRLNIARIAFHESMHNQMESDNRMHATGGFAAAAPVGTSPSARNIADMARHIGTHIPQWEGGFQAWQDWDNTRP